MLTRLPGKMYVLDRYNCYIIACRLELNLMANPLAAIAGFCGSDSNILIDE
jgi:hypothetical protein